MSRSTFSCPYCCSDIPLQASVCSHCTRDLVLFKPLALRLQDLADEVQALKALVQQSSQAWAQLPAQDIGAAALSYAQTQHAPPNAETAKPPSWPAWLLSVVFTLGVCRTFLNSQ